MLHYSLKFSTIQLFLVGLIAVTTEVQKANSQSSACSDITFPRNSTYETNRATLLTYLVSNATNSAGFYNASVGQGPDQVNGLFLCRGDVSNTDCRTCVASASQVIVERCPEDKGAIVWYDYCLLRYLNEPIFSTVNTEPSVRYWNTNTNITNDESRLVVSSMNDVATMAASAPSGAKKFAVNQTSLNGSQTLYSLAQCTPDLSSSQCDFCLRQAIGKLTACCPYNRGAQVLSPSCNIRYEVYPFYNGATVPSAPPPAALPPPPISVTRPNGKVDGNEGHSVYNAIFVSSIPPPPSLQRTAFSPPIEVIKV